MLIKLYKGNYLAIGTNYGNIEIWDVQHNKKIRDMGGHKLRVGSLAWNIHLLTSGFYFIIHQK